ncbi:PucR family transcriptional regulator [Actinophytocola sediminis]
MPSRDTDDGQLRLLCQAAAGQDGLRRVLELLARRLTAEIVLAGPPTVEVGSPAGHLGRLVGEDLADDLARVRSGHVDAVAVHAGGHDIAILPVGPAPTRPVLVVARRGRLTAAHRRLLAAAVDLLWLCWRSTVAEQRTERLDAADATMREAVLHLLMVGQLSGARRTAATLRPALPDLARIYLVAGGPDSRGMLSLRCKEVFGDTAWVVPCPVYSGHVIVIAPAAPDPVGLIRQLTETAPETRMGVGLQVALRDIPIGYKQAFHALTVARTRSARYAQFSPRGELGELLGRAGRAWAASTLAPLLAYRPARLQDPDAFELLATLLSWLDFGAGAASQLKIHRNTLSARLRRIGAELRCDLTRFATQAELYLALQLIDERPHPDPTAEMIEFDTLFDRQEIRDWAETQLSPLLPDNRRTLLTTVHTWFANDLRTTPVAAALGISAQGLRKRLARAEELLGRALLVGPSARYTVYHALRVHHGIPAR